MIDADGLALMPGIIDSHTHYDAQITWDPFVRPSPALGVTTAVIGNCGFTIAPCRPQDRDITMRNLTHVEGMSLEVLRQGIEWGFETFPEYLAQLRERRQRGQRRLLRRPLQRPHLRDGRRRAERAATRDEIAQMQAIVREAMAGRRRRLRQQHLARRTTAKAACRCPRAWPTTARCGRWSRRWANAATASTC